MRSKRGRCDNVIFSILYLSQNHGFCNVVSGFRKLDVTIERFHVNIRKGVPDFFLIQRTGLFDCFCKDINGCCRLCGLIGNQLVLIFRISRFEFLIIICSRAEQIILIGQSFGPLRRAQEPFYRFSEFTVDVRCFTMGNRDHRHFHVLLTNLPGCCRGAF